MSCILAFSQLKRTQQSTMRSTMTSNRPRTTMRANLHVRPPCHDPYSSYSTMSESLVPLPAVTAALCEPATTHTAHHSLHPIAYRLSSIQTNSRTHMHTCTSKTGTLTTGKMTFVVRRNLCCALYFGRTAKSLFAVHIL
jgi:hypothetical protein